MGDAMIQGPSSNRQIDREDPTQGSSSTPEPDEHHGDGEQTMGIRLGIAESSRMNLLSTEKLNSSRKNLEDATRNQNDSHAQPENEESGAAELASKQLLLSETTMTPTLGERSGSARSLPRQSSRTRRRTSRVGQRRSSISSEASLPYADPLSDEEEEILDDFDSEDFYEEVIIEGTEVEVSETDYPVGDNDDATIVEEYTDVETAAEDTEIEEEIIEETIAEGQDGDEEGVSERVSEAFFTDPSFREELLKYLVGTDNNWSNTPGRRGMLHRRDDNDSEDEAQQALLKQLRGTRQTRNDSNRPSRKSSRASSAEKKRGASVTDPENGDVEDDADDEADEDKDDSEGDDDDGDNHEEDCDDEDDDDCDDDDDEPDAKEVADAIAYFMKIEKVVEKGILTAEESAGMSILKIAAMKAILDHLESCSNSEDPIQWDLLKKIYNDEHGIGDDDEVSNSDDKHSSLLEESDQDSEMDSHGKSSFCLSEEDREWDGYESIGSGHSLDACSSHCGSSITYEDGTDEYIEELIVPTHGKEVASAHILNMRELRRTASK